MMAMVDWGFATILLSDNRAERLAAAEAASMRALSLVPEHALAHQALAQILGVTNRAEQGIAECERALAIDRNLAAAHATIGARKVYIGRAEETEAHVREALRLSPRDTSAFLWLMFVGLAKNLLGSHEEAVVWLRRSIEVNRNSPPSHILLAAALANLGQLEEARAAIRGLTALTPQASITRFQATLGSFSDNPIFRSGLQRIIDGLRKAGLPEE
jgi:tetratricopeptide (TPR) repeat protein